MKKVVLIIATVSFILNGCGFANDKASSDSLQAATSDTTGVEEAEVETGSPFYSADLGMHNIKGKATSAVTKVYIATADGVQEGFLNETKLSFNEKGEWTGNEEAVFNPSKIKRDSNGRIQSLMYTRNVDYESKSTLCYTYDGEYTKTYSYDAEGESSSNCKYTLFYDNEGNIIKEKGDGYCEGTVFDISIDYKILQSDSHGNWTKRFVKKVTKESYEDEESGTHQDVYTDYTIEVRKLTYSE